MKKKFRVFFFHKFEFEFDKYIDRPTFSTQKKNNKLYILDIILVPNELLNQSISYKCIVYFGLVLFQFMFAFDVHKLVIITCANASKI